MIEFAWFYLLKIVIFAIFLYLVGRPFYKQYKETGSPFMKSKFPYFVAFVFLVVLIVNPVKIDNLSKTENVRLTYDKQVEEVLPEIKKHTIQEYKAPDNREEIEKLMQQGGN